MAVYTPDFEFLKAKKLIEELDTSEQSRLIRYYIGVKDEIIKRQNEQLSEFYDWFAQLDRFLPNKNPIIY
jgi:hypothetical protein